MVIQSVEATLPSCLPRFDTEYSLKENNSLHKLSSKHSTYICKSIAGGYLPVRVADGPITAHYRLLKMLHVAGYLSQRLTKPTIRPMRPAKTQISL